jgi:hypothetical protein
MSFNRRKKEDQRRQAAEKEAAARWATDAQELEDRRPALNHPGWLYSAGLGMSLNICRGCGACCRIPPLFLPARFWGGNNQRKYKNALFYWG